MTVTTLAREAAGRFAAVGAALLIGAAASTSALAETIVKFPLAETNVPDVYFDGTVFGTVDDAVPLTPGDQQTRITFLGALDAIPDLELAYGSFTLDNVTATGTPMLAGPIVVQETTGGNFSLYDENDVLLLSGTLGSGAINGSVGDTAGSFFNTSFATFTGGTLASMFIPTSGSISLSLLSIVAENGLVSKDGQGNPVALNPFTADATGQIGATAAVPEPATGLLLIPGVLAARRMRRKREAATV